MHLYRLKWIAVLSSAILYTACSQPSSPPEPETPAQQESIPAPETPTADEPVASGEQAEHDGMASSEPEAEVHTHADGSLHEHEATMGGMAGEAAAHQDHDPKHGGTFFMSLDGRFHLEGVLVDPGVFRVFLYDEFLKPVSGDLLAGSEARVIWGSQDDAPELPMKLSSGSQPFEASAPGTMRFPVTLTLLVRFAGSNPGASRELFTFPFSHYTHDPNTGH